MTKKLQLFSVLDVDAMFFHSALNNCSIAKKNKGLSDKYTQDLASISWLDDYEAWNLGDDIDIDFSDEDMKYVEGLKNDVTESTGIFLQTTASTHIFCVAALEAHINNIAKTLLIKKQFDHFEKLSLEGKWLFLPQLLSKESFTPGNQPFQDFAKLVKIRNALVHYKGKKVPYDTNQGAVDLYKSLGLTIEDAEKSLEATKKMIEKIAELIERKPPSWIKDTSHEYYRIDSIILDK